MNSRKRNGRMLKISAAFMFTASLLMIYFGPDMGDLAITLSVMGFAVIGLIVATIIETFIRQ